MLETQNRIGSASGKDPSGKNTYFHTIINPRGTQPKKKKLEISKQVHQTVPDKEPNSRFQANPISEGKTTGKIQETDKHANSEISDIQTHQEDQNILKKQFQNKLLIVYKLKA